MGNIATNMDHTGFRINVLPLQAYRSRSRLCMGALAGMGVGAAVGGAVAGVPGALTGMQVGIAVGAVGGTVYGGIVGCTSIAETADGLMTKIRRLF